MNREKIKQIVSEAFDVDNTQRDAFVRKACGNDQTLLAEALSLLDAASNASDAGFFPSNHGNGHDAPTVHRISKAGDSGDVDAPLQFGRYKVLERIGEGGMGIVYRAEQRVPMRREVVVKVIKLGMDTKLVIARFEAERQALAMMDHPHIAKVFDAGTDDRGRPYFVMEYVKGTPILDYCDRNHLVVKQRLELFMQVCQAIQHAHHKGIIHRDIKPSNILVSTQDGKPFAKVIDFGIAKATNQRLTDRTLFTEHVNMIGTPAYMSPEQADGNIDIDTRTDVYSLGVVLYELLTGHTPFDSARLKSVALNEVARIIREEDPPKPSTRVNTINSASSSKSSGGVAAENRQTLATVAKARGSNADVYAKSLQGEIDWMVMKAIEKDRARRYATPNELAEDVERHLNGLTILAAPPSLIYQAKKFAKKYKVVVSASLTIAAVLLIAIASVSGLAIELSHQVSVTRTALKDAEAARVQESLQRQEAERQRGTAESAARRANYGAARNQAQYLIEQKLLDQALPAAKEAYQLGGGWEDGMLLSQIVNKSRETWHLEHSIQWTEHPVCAAIVNTVTGPIMVVASASSLAEFDLATGKLLVQVNTTFPIKQLVPFRSTVGQLIAVTRNSIELVQLSDLTLVRRQDFGATEVEAVDAGFYSIAVTLSDRSTNVYTGALFLRGSQPWPAGARLSQNQSLFKLAISPDGQWVVSSGLTWWDDCLFWNVSTNKTFLASTRAYQLRFIDSLTLIAETTHVDYEGTTLSRLNIDPIQNKISSIKLCNIPEDDLGQPLRHVADFRGISIPGAWGYAVVTFGKSSDAFPDIVTQRYDSLIGRSGLSPHPLALAADGSRFAIACGDQLLIFDQSRAPWQHVWAKGHNAAMGSSNLYEVESDGTALYLRITAANADRPPIRRHIAPLPVAPSGMSSIACGAAISSDQRMLAVRYAQSFGDIIIGKPTQNHIVVIYSGLDPITGRPGNTPPLEIRLVTQDSNADAAAREYSNERILEFSPDGQYLLVGTRATDDSSVVELYRTGDGQLVHYWQAGQLSGIVNSVGHSRYFPDASVSGNSIRLISWETGNVEREINVPGRPTGLCGSAGGRQMLVSIDGNQILRYDLNTGELIGKITSPLVPTDCSPDGKVFIGYLADSLTATHGNLILADLQTGNTLAVLARGARRRSPARFAADGRSFMLGSLVVAELVRNITPEDADRILAGSDSAKDLALEPAKIDLPPIKVFPKLQPVSDGKPPPAIEATDIAALMQNVGSKAAVQGKTTWTGLTIARDALTISFGEPNVSFTVYIPPEVFPAINAKFGGSALSALNQKVLRVTGTIIIYRRHPEIKIDDAAQIELVNAPAATEPAP